MKTNIVQVTEDEVREMEKYARVMPQTDDDGNLIVRRYVYRHNEAAYWTGEHWNGTRDEAKIYTEGEPEETLIFIKGFINREYLDQKITVPVRKTYWLNGYEEIKGIEVPDNRQIDPDLIPLGWEGHNIAIVRID